MSVCFLPLRKTAATPNRGLDCFTDALPVVRKAWVRAATRSSLRMSSATSSSVLHCGSREE